VSPYLFFKSPPKITKQSGLFTEISRWWHNIFEPPC